MTTVTKVLLDALKQVRFSVNDIHVGICENVYYELKAAGLMPGENYRAAKNKLSSLFIKWPKYSGDWLFPIPDPEIEQSEYCLESAEFAYIKALKYKYTWDKNHPYGALRWELLEFCITELEVELTENLLNE